MNIKIVIIKRTLLIIGCLWVFIGFSVITYKVLCKDFTFAATDHSGDGIGTIAGIGFLKSQPFLQNDNNGIISSLMVVPIANDDKWWIIKRFLALFFSPDNVYDYLVLSFWLLNLIAGYYLFRTLKLDQFSAVIFGLTIAGLEVFPSRISGHLTMAAVFIPILQIAYAFKLLESPSGRNIYIFSLLCFASFLSNEYYGYFGFIFSMALILFYYLLNFKRIKEFKFKEIFLGICIFCSGMLLGYADIFRALIVNNGTKAFINHSFSEHIYYSVINPFEIFFSRQYDIKTRLSNPDEFTFHLGIVILIFILAHFLYAIVKRVYLDNKLIFSILFSGLVLSLFGLNPDYPLSLEKITYIIAPQLRVGARAYLWVSFAIIIMAAILYRDIMRAQFQGKSKKSTFIPPLLSFSLILILLDTTMGFYIKGPSLYPLPRNLAFKEISDYPQGLLLELPFFGPSDPPELSYRYMYDYIDHKKMFINYPSSQLYQYDPTLASGLDHFKKYLNNPDREVIDLLSRAGIKYLAVNDSIIKFKFDNMGYIPIVSLDGVAIYEFNAENEFDVKSLVLCNSLMLEYDKTNIQYLPSTVGILLPGGISSTGVGGYLLYGPFATVGAGEYNLHIYGNLSSGSVNIKIVSNRGNVEYRQFTLDRSMANIDGEFSIQRTVIIADAVNDLEVKFLVNEDSAIEIRGYDFSNADSSPQCQGLMFNLPLR